MLCNGPVSSSAPSRPCWASAKLPPPVPPRLSSDSPAPPGPPPSSPVSFFLLEQPMLPTVITATSTAHPTPRLFINTPRPGNRRDHSSHLDQAGLLSLPFPSVN